jgi:hypothetical protein
VLPGPVSPRQAASVAGVASQRGWTSMGAT